jgi:hypothetical protein
MKYLKNLWLLAVVLISTTTMSQNLDSFKWENRILLLKDSDFSSGELEEQLKVLQNHLEKLRERDILVFIVTNDAVLDTLKRKTILKSKQIIEAYGLKDFQGLILIGKDGGIKLKESFVVSPQAIFTLIDGMPMRQAEMKHSKKH